MSGGRPYLRMTEHSTYPMGALSDLYHPFYSVALRSNNCSAVYDAREIGEDVGYPLTLSRLKLPIATTGPTQH